MSTLSTTPNPLTRPPSTLAGKVITPGHARYDEARRAWKLTVDQRPAAIVVPESADDVAAAIMLSSERGHRIAVQATGHGAGPLGALEDTILLKTERLRDVRVDGQSRLARVQAGALWLDVVEAAAAHGLAALACSSPDVGVVGYTLGGGLSLIGRNYGLCASAVRAIELVTADGRLVRCDHEHEPDLFWALRGGGGSFGVVTAIELELLPLEHAYAGVLFYPIERGSEVLHAWRQLTASRELPDELSTVGRYLRVPPIPEVPEQLRGQSFVVVHVYHVGEPAQADELLAPLRALRPLNDTIQAVPIPALGHVHMEPEQPMPAAGDGLLLAELPGEALDAFIEVAGEDADVPLVSVELRHLGGELARPRPTGGALPAIDAQYALYAVGFVPTPEQAAPVRAQVRAIQAALGPWAARQMFLNLADTRRRAASFWSEQAYARLRRIKADVDPDNRIRANHEIATHR